MAKVNYYSDWELRISITLVLFVLLTFSFFHTINTFFLIGYLLGFWLVNILFDIIIFFMNRSLKIKR